MSDWERTLDLYFNTEARTGNAMLLIEGTSVRESVTPIMVEGDKFTLRLFFRKKLATGGVETVELPSSSVLGFAGKLATRIGTGDPLLACESFAFDGEGDAANWQGTLDLNTVELAAAFSGEEKQIAVTCDLEIQNADNSERITLQADIIIRRQVYDGETGPTPFLVKYEEYLNATGALCGRLKNSNGETIGSFAPAGEET
ncbi:MAG: hypothetical protein HQ559_07320 [Lentisphaerae bacterium]|nr:hypothetical protein [Lentisphaerota bacterium]